MAPIVLITRLAALAEAVAELLDAQRHAAQAAEARAAAERLDVAARGAPRRSRVRLRASAPPLSSQGYPSPASAAHPAASSTRRARPQSRWPATGTPAAGTTPTRGASAS